MAGKQVMKWLPIPMMLVFFSSLFFSSLATDPSESSKVNLVGPYLALISTSYSAANALFATGAFKPHPKYPYLNLSGRTFHIGTIGGTQVIIVNAGSGLVNAAATTQQLLDAFRTFGVVHFGIAGNANNSLNIGDVVIPKEFAQAGLWDWLKPKQTLSSKGVAELDFGSFHVPNKGFNQLWRVAYTSEDFYSWSGKPDSPERKFWFQTSQGYLELASTLQGIELNQCLGKACLGKKPKLVVGLKGATANIFVDNAAYREFLYRTFQVSSVDMESAAVVMTSMSNGRPVIVIRGLSDLAGQEQGENLIAKYGYLASVNAAKVVVEFVKRIPQPRG